MPPTDPTRQRGPAFCPGPSPARSGWYPESDDARPGVWRTRRGAGIIVRVRPALRLRTGVETANGCAACDLDRGPLAPAGARLRLRRRPGAGDDRATTPDFFPIYTESGRWKHRGELWTDWCGGFHAGMMWLIAERTGDPWWRQTAEHYSRLLEHRQHDRDVHDLGFIFLNTYLPWYRLTGDEHAPTGADHGRAGPWRCGSTPGAVPPVVPRAPTACSSTS